MGKGNRKLSCCTTENIGLDLSSCWMDGETGTGHGCRRPPIKTVAVIKPIDIEIRNRIGGFFRGYNIISYGFTDASLNIDVVFLLNGYACLCRDGIATAKPGNTTVSLISGKKPKGLMQQLGDSEIAVEKEGQGIYHFQYMLDFQVVVLEELPRQEKAWLEGLVAQ